MAASYTSSQVRQIRRGIVLLLVIMVVICGILLGYPYLPGVLGEWVGMMVGLATTPFLLEATFLIFGFCVIFWLNHLREKNEGGEWVTLEEMDGSGVPEHARWAVLPADAPRGEEPGLLDEAEGAADVGDWEGLVDVLAKLDERDLKSVRVLRLRERLARATGRNDLAEELAGERRAAEKHA